MAAKTSGKSSAGLQTTSRGGMATPKPVIQTQKAAQTAAANPTVTTTAPVSPFLTPAQQQTKDADYGTYQQNLNSWNQAISDDTSTEGQNEATQNYNAKVSAAQSAALDAARGIMGSGIAMGDLADINTTLANNLLTLRTNLASTVTGINKQIGTANGAWNQEVLDYDSAAAENGQSQAPTTTTTRVQPTAAQAMPAAPKPVAAPAPTQPTTPAVVKPSTPSATNKTVATKLAGGSGFNTATQPALRGGMQGTAGGW